MTKAAVLVTIFIISRDLEIYHFWLFLRRIYLFIVFLLKKINITIKEHFASVSQHYWLDAFHVFENFFKGAFMFLRNTSKTPNIFWLYFHSIIESLGYRKRRWKQHEKIIFCFVRSDNKGNDEFNHSNSTGT